MKAGVQLRRTPAPPLPISVLSLCHQGDIAQGTPFFFLFFLSGIEAQPCLFTINHLRSCDVGIKTLFFSDDVSQISLYQTNDCLIMIQTKERN